LEVLGLVALTVKCAVNADVSSTTIFSIDVAEVLPRDLTVVGERQIERFVG
jgi:hypothetical protein